ncbi:MAG: universal stress protein [Ramlibacter sp.]|jgi:nucleotide-binding universal stress UspA family protein|nr:universal stress protein [Ramlibacter sp.]
MAKVLVPMQPDQPAKTMAAVEAAIRLHRQENAAVHLLSVQSRINGHVASYFGADELRQLQQKMGREDLADARRQLDAAGVPYTTSMAVGRRADTIALTAREYGCRRVLLGAPPESDVVGTMFGSLADQLRHMIRVTGGFEVIGS